MGCMDFKSYVAHIVWEADHDDEAFPPDSYHVWCVEGSGTSLGSLSSLESIASGGNGDDDNRGFVHSTLSQWGPKFRALSEIYDQSPRQGGEKHPQEP